MVYNGYYKVMSNIPKMGQLPRHGSGDQILFLGVDSIQFLVGGFNLSEQYEFVSWDDCSQCMEQSNSCSKSPISNLMGYK